MNHSTNQLLNYSTILLIIFTSFACGGENSKNDDSSNSASSTVEKDTTQEQETSSVTGYENDFESVEWIEDPSVFLDVKRLYGRHKIKTSMDGGVDISDDPKAVKTLFGEHSKNGQYRILQYHPLDYEYFGIVASTDYGQRFPYETHFILCSDKTGEPEQQLIIAYTTMGDLISTGESWINTTNATEGELEIQLAEKMRFADGPPESSEGEPAVTTYTLDGGVFLKSQGVNCDYSEDWLVYVKNASPDYGDGVEVELADGTSIRLATQNPDLLLNNKGKWIKGLLCHQHGLYEEDNKYVLLRSEVHLAPKPEVEKAYLAAMGIKAANNAIKRGGDFLAYCDEEHSVDPEGFKSTTESNEVGAVYFGHYEGCTSGPLKFVVHSNGYCIYDNDLQTDKYWVGDFELNNGLRSGMTVEEVRQLLGTEMHFENDLMIYPIYDIVGNYDGGVSETKYTPGVHLLFDQGKLIGAHLHQDYLC